MRRLLGYLSAVLLAATPAAAASVQLEGSLTPGLPGYTTLVYSLQTGAGESFRGVDFTMNGPMNQINPLGVSTIFTDNNPVITATGGNSKADSQFLFHLSTVFAVGAAESNSQLKGGVSGLDDNGLPNPAPFAQIVTNQLSSLFGNATFDLGGPTAYSVSFNQPLDPPSLPGISHDDLTIEATPLPGLSGYTAYTIYLDVRSALHDRLTIVGGAAGPLYQAPGGLPTPFAPDPTAGVAAVDSHFGMMRGALRDNDPSCEVDTAALLQGRFAIDTNLYNTELLPVMQIVTNDPASVDFDFSISVYEGAGELRFTGTLVPEPTTALLLASAALAASMRMRD